MMARLLWTLSSAAFVLALATAGTATAASYGNFIGGTVDFLNVADGAGLFGAPTVSVDTLDFSPNAFEADCAASATCPPTPHNVSDTLILDISAKNGFFVDEIRLTEAGDTSLASFGSAFANTSVVADVFVDILAINGSAVNGINANAQMVFTSNGAFDTDTQGNGTHAWNGLLDLDIDAIIAANGGSGQATLVRISLSNTLTAFAESGAAARIEKKDLDGLAITVIPEPTTALLMGMGLTGLSLISRRRRSA